MDNSRWKIVSLWSIWTLFFLVFVANQAWADAYVGAPAPNVALPATGSELSLDPTRE